ncbi:hypothetical protein HGRIS_012705 [Hohenbuehelia grisea]|uniref:CCHC-type domain-containing protein n=1 Tax=Hohenbuehelia grisea TaxID=104357 RepID=A0ABR3IT59_9AGAR
MAGGECERDGGDSRAELIPHSSQSATSFIFPHFEDATPGGLYLGPYAISTVYSRHADSILGHEDLDAEPPDSESNAFVIPQCFNCGSPSHTYQNCTERRNRELIALSRQMFHFHNPEASRSERLHVVYSWRAKRLQWVDAFTPGIIRGSLLKGALGIKGSEDDNQPSEPSEVDFDEDELNPDLDVDYPWLRSMAYWGYPPGWAGTRDPREKMRHRIEHGDDGIDVSDDDDTHFVIHHGEGDVEEMDISSSGYLPPAESASDVDVSDPMSESEESDSSCTASTASASLIETDHNTRWALYPATQFSSSLLPIYNGIPLPALVEHEYEPLYPFYAPPPSTPPPPLPPPPAGSPPPLPPSEANSSFAASCTSSASHSLTYANTIQEDEELDMDISDSESD